MRVQEHARQAAYHTALFQFDRFVVEEDEAKIGEIDKLAALYLKK